MTELRRSDSGFAPVKGTKLYYEVAGNGHPLVLLHAGGLDSRMWDDQFSVFSEHFRVIRYDMRGFGKSLVGDIPFSFHQDLYDLLKYLYIERTHVLGLSRGATIAIDFTLAYPQMVDALILVASRAGCSRPSEAVQKIWAESDALAEKRMIDEVVEMELRFWVDGPKRTPHQVNPKVRERVKEMSAHNTNLQ
ncbi:alpha/beta fold hydrolase [Candidatus Acetothermia bacterium]|nr:alpha/beta fold hydrolase [Candidatus Acetothermia bacterium]